MTNKELPKITSVMLCVTHACNLRCRYCFVSKKPETMTFQTAKDSALWLLDNCKGTEDIPHINFFGGEPTLCWNTIIEPLVIYVHDELHANMNFAITTNGILLNDERIQFMKQHHFGFLFSIDGDKETQDYNRPCKNPDKSSFDILAPLIPQLSKEFQTTFRMTAIPATCQNIFHNIKFAEDNGYKSFFIMPNLFEEWPDEKWTILQDELHKYSLYFIDSFTTAGRAPIAFSAFNKGLDSITKINKAIQNDECRVNHYKGLGYGKCGLGATKYASIHPNGNLYACQEMTSNEGENSIFYIGNIYTGVRDDLRYNLISQYNALQSTTTNNCVDCRKHRICDNGCVANNYLATGNINTPSLTWCKWEQLLLEEAIYVTLKLGNNSSFIQYWRNRYENK